MLEIVTGIFASLIAALVISLVSKAVVQTGVLTRFNDKSKLLLFKSGSSFRKRVLANPQSAIKFFTRWLGRDQSLVGTHKGQFGKRASLMEEKLFQTGKEKLKIKPRLYLTGWPCFILAELNLGEKYLRRAVSGIKELLEGGSVKVYLGATAKTPPDRQPRIVSYRHTIRAVQILVAMKRGKEIVAEVVGRMLDPKRGWQNKDSGWAQCDEEYTESDLWASTYALKLLHAIHQRKVELPEKVHKSAKLAISPTIDFLEREWRESGWAYGNASSAHNGIQIVHETIWILKEYRPKLAQELLQWVKTWLTPATTVSELYYEECPGVLRSSNDARVSYALFQAGESSDVWIHSYESALSGFRAGVNCVDVAILLHLTFILAHSEQGRLSESLKEKQLLSAQ